MKKKTIYILFISTLLIIIAFFVASIIKTNIYNSISHEREVSGKDLFTSIVDKNQEVSINAVARPNTWGKIYDPLNEGITENNYKAYTIDFIITNNTGDEVTNFKFKYIFKKDAFLSSAWNGELKIYQNVNNNQKIEYVEDLREYNPSGSRLEKVEIDEEYFIRMYADDYFIYIPVDKETPIRAHEETKPGMIAYVKVNENLEDSVIVFNYTLYRYFTSDSLFWISFIGFIAWFIVLAIYVITSIQTKKYQLRHERDNEIINESIETFTGFIDAKDPYTNGHSKRVAIYTKLIAEKMGYTGEELDKIYYIALLHDCGKIAIPDNILGKPGKLTDEEFEVIKSHTVRGDEILSSFKSLKNAGAGARYHHERYDGRGYPEGLKGEDIPLIARMICVADAFDAMNSNRVYRQKRTSDYIIEELTKNKGTQFDPKIAEIMLQLIKEGKVNVG